MTHRANVAAVALLTLAVTALAIPWTVAAQDADTADAVTAAMKSLCTAEADFRSNDRDGNLVNDFWTADVYGLYALRPITGGATQLPADTEDQNETIRLIQEHVAAADGQSLTGGYAKLTVKNALKAGKGQAYRGHIFRAFLKQDDGTGATDLRKDTDGKEFYGKVHDRNRFAFLAAPEKLASGKLFYLINADNTLWSFKLDEKYAMKFTAITPEADASSDFKTGKAEFDNAEIFPAAPGALGCSKPD